MICEKYYEKEKQNLWFWTTASDEDIQKRLDQMFQERRHPSSREREIRMARLSTEFIIKANKISNKPKQLKLFKKKN